jgi:hypothetical protein
MGEQAKDEADLAGGEGLEALEERLRRWRSPGCWTRLEADPDEPALLGACHRESAHALGGFRTPLQYSMGLTANRASLVSLRSPGGRAVIAFHSRAVFSLTYCLMSSRPPPRMAAQENSRRHGRARCPVHP